MSSLLSKPLFDFLLELLHIFWGKCGLAKWAVVLLLEPVFDAVRVEVMLYVARQRGHFAVIGELIQADGALVVLES